jgi:hypothetical protein
VEDTALVFHTSPLVDRDTLLFPLPEEAGAPAPYYTVSPLVPLFFVLAT